MLNKAYFQYNEREVEMRQIGKEPRAQRYGLHWDPYRGLVSAPGRLTVHQTEAEIYRALDLEFIAPENRELPFLQKISAGTRAAAKNQNERCKP